MRVIPGRKVRTWYNIGDVEWALRGVTTCRETWRVVDTPTSYDCGGSVGALRRVEHHHDALTDANGITTVSILSQDVYVLEGHSVGEHIRNEWEWDDFGNKTRAIEWGRYDGLTTDYGADEAMTETDWIVDSTLWSIRLPEANPTWDSYRIDGCPSDGSQGGYISLLRR